MNHSIDMVIKRDDGTRVRPTEGLWGSFTEYDFNPYFGFGLYTAIACWSRGVSLKDILWFTSEADHTETVALLDELLNNGFVSVTVPPSGTLYHAQGLEEVL